MTHTWITLADQEEILRISPLGNLGRFEPTANFFCLHCFNQLSKWANAKVTCCGPFFIRWLHVSNELKVRACHYLVDSAMLLELLRLVTSSGEDAWESSIDPMADSLTYNSSVDWIDGEDELRYPELRSSPPL